MSIENSCRTVKYLRNEEKEMWIERVTSLGWEILSFEEKRNGSYYILNLVLRRDTNMKNYKEIKEIETEISNLNQIAKTKLLLKEEEIKKISGSSRIKSFFSVVFLVFGIIFLIIGLLILILIFSKEKVDLSKYLLSFFLYVIFGIGFIFLSKFIEKRVNKQLQNMEENNLIEKELEDIKALYLKAKRLTESEE